MQPKVYQACLVRLLNYLAYITKDVQKCRMKEKGLMIDSKSYRVR